MELGTIAVPPIELKYLFVGLSKCTGLKAGKKTGDVSAKSSCQNALKLSSISPMSI